MCVLLVEDDPITRCAVVTVLQAKGIEVVEAASGLDAIALFEAAPDGFTALVTDYDLPGMHGLNLATHIRRITPDLPIVVASGHPEALHVSREPGLQIHLLRKPYSADALLVMLAVAGAHYA